MVRVWTNEQVLPVIFIPLVPTEQCIVDVVKAVDTHQAAQGGTQGGGAAPLSGDEHAKAAAAAQVRLPSPPPLLILLLLRVSCASVGGVARVARVVPSTST